MTVEYDITSEDLQAYQLHHHRHSPAIRRSYFTAWLVFPSIWFLLWAALCFFGGRDGKVLRTAIALLPLLSAVPIYLAWFPWAYRRKLKKITASLVNEGTNRGILGRHTLSISPAGIIESNAHGQTSRAWSAIERIDSSAAYAFIYLGSLSAIVVPRRAFANEAAFDNFVVSATGYLERTPR